MTRKGDTKYYDPGQSDWWTSARVERVHRDGTVSIQTLFEVKPRRDASGLSLGGFDEVGGYLGFKYRVPLARVVNQPPFPVALTADLVWLDHLRCNDARENG